MTVEEAIAKIRKYWPDSKQIAWGEALDVICNAAESCQRPTTQVKSSADATAEQIKPCEHHRCSPGNYGLENFCDHPNAWEW